MPAQLDGKIALVTGAGRGIGRAIALELGSAGAHVVLCARTSAEIEQVAREITVARGEATAVCTDLSVEDDILAAFERVQKRFGRLDVLVNNAGVGAFGPIAEVEAADIDRVFAVNVKAAFLCCRQAMQMMIPRRSGAIINISSVVGFRGYANQGVYSAGKHALRGMTKVLAKEAQEHGIRVSTIAPGGVDTELIRRARPDLDTSTLMKPEDIAQTVMFLLSLSDRAAIDEIYIRRWGSTPF